MDKELEKILRQMMYNIRDKQNEGIELKIALEKMYKEIDGIINNTISQIKSLAKREAKECVQYKVMDIGGFDDEGNLIKKYPKPKEVIITDSEICKDILKNIDQKFK